MVHKEYTTHTIEKNCQEIEISKSELNSKKKQKYCVQEKKWCVENEEEEERNYAYKYLSSQHT